jgi:hypothetical protein
MKRLENWGLIQLAIGDIYSAPEVVPKTYHVVGLLDGRKPSPLRSSAIARFDLDAKKVETANSTYQLGEIDSNFYFLYQMIAAMERDGIPVIASAVEDRELLDGLRRDPLNDSLLKRAKGLLK